MHTKQSENEKLDKERAAAKVRYEEILAALERENAIKTIQFEISPNQSLFKEMSQRGSISPLNIELKSSSGAIFKMKMKFHPEEWTITIPENSTKEERGLMRDVLLDTIANTSEEDQPKILVCFSEGIPEEEITEFVQAAKERGMDIHIFVGNEKDFRKIVDTTDNWETIVKNLEDSEGGKKGLDILENNTEVKSSFQKM